MSHIQTLRTMLREDKGVILPGAPNALAARIIADLGFRAVYLTGAGLTNMHLGLPDLGFMDLSQVAAHVMAIRGVIDLPLIVDAGAVTASCGASVWVSLMAVSLMAKLSINAITAPPTGITHSRRRRGL